MTTSALLRHGPAYIHILIDGLIARLQEKQYASVGQMRGILSRPTGPDPSAYERANYVRIVATSSPR
jgi:dihydroorotate dehydrogenase (fumarate)